MNNGDPMASPAKFAGRNPTRVERLPQERKERELRKINREYIITPNPDSAADVLDQEIFSPPSPSDSARASPGPPMESRSSGGNDSWSLDISIGSAVLV